ncbi:hypothetical protein D554_3615 [Bordetella holmesii 30539]|uniref:N-acetyltransferase YedL n=1 Tax=Bordetella holmesii 1058 TaxID=1247648 RepID=A0ABP3BGK5_9BORD|nr:hypothetical protein D560_3723 [Bordetella holmesii ATCC 51541]EWM41129.1 hypothetical protein D555_3774 [Bordetella holmesii 35009]EWM41966.1 hypothetical protein D556_3704 [Bordetella holmesii 41130]EWM45017.1 hypothetical protein D557_3006 [Bordetella holmesii 70147]EXF88338.1 hypothetical protein D554_3615 [Bordetella holmesii 30539]EXX94339.1 hypothetical protein D559_1748 [Bordetella holmesii 1058]
MGLFLRFALHAGPARGLLPSMTSGARPSDGQQAADIVGRFGPVSA